MDIFNEIDNLDDEYLIVGVSAGPDSMALIHMLQHKTNKKLVCTHINHNVRKESAEEANYLKEYCKENNIIFECLKIDTYKENNFEDEARKKRYNFYKKILKKYHSHTLLLAHHGDDLIETILMKIIRGSNIQGYAGIKKYSYLKDYTIIRPLLNLTKEDLIKYNKENNIKYYIDSSNEDITYTRNRLRKKILPLLKKEDKNIHQKFINYSETLQEYYNLANEIANQKMINIVSNATIDINKIKKENALIQKQIIFNLLSNIYNNESNIIKNEHIDSIISIINNTKPNIKIDLPNNYIAIKEYDKLSFTKKTNSIDYKIPFKESIRLDNIIIEKVKEINTDGNDICRINSKKIKLPLYIRNRQRGDYIEVLGLDGKKKIKDIFIEKKIPLTIRNSYPLLVDAEDKILWIPFLKKSKYIVKKDGLYDIILYSYKESEEKNERQKEN